MLRSKPISFTLALRPREDMRCSTMAGSISPQRVPIISPSRGVSPMDVSMLWPPLTAATLLPLPAPRAWVKYRWLKAGGNKGNRTDASQQQVTSGDIVRCELLWRQG